MTFTDSAVVEQFVLETVARKRFDLAYDLLKHRLLLVTRHMDMLPESLLSPQGRRLKREREKVLRSTASGRLSARIPQLKSPRAPFLGDSSSPTASPSATPTPAP